MLGSGKWAKPKDMAYMCGLMGIDTKDSLISASNMAKEQKDSPMEISIKVNMLRENQAAMVTTTGLTAPTLKATLSKGYGKDMGYGRNRQVIVINTKESITKTKNMGTGSFLGRQVTSTKATIVRI